MQQLADLDAQADGGGIRPLRKRKASARRKVTVRLSESVCGRLDVATDRPGVGKSMFVEAALEQLLNPAPSVEALVQEGFDQMQARFDRFEHDMRMIAETVALHARYQLAVTPPVARERQREAILLGDERFKVLAEQVGRRVQQRRPLMQETIDRLSSVACGSFKPVTGEDTLRDPEPGLDEGKLACEDADVEQESSAVVGEGGRSLYVHHRSKAFCQEEATANKVQNPRPTPPKCDPQSTGASEASQKRSLSNWRLILSVFVPFAAGYYLAYLFRTINAAIAPALASDFGLDATQMGLLASVYFLVFGFAQLPIGMFVDRYGPRRVQGVLLVIAAGGATLFGNAGGFAELLVARAMIGLGVAGSLMAGLKAIVTWFPRERVALVNGWMIMLGSLGAVTATTPTDWLLELIGWRSLFEVLTIATVAVSALIYMVSPERPENSEITAAARKPLTFWSVYSDSRFLRVAPLSASCIGSSWALHSLWAAAWLTDVQGLARESRVIHLFLMAVALSVGALLLGALADRLRKHNIKTEVVLASVGGLFVLAELALVLRVPLPSLLPWSIVSVAGAATVLSFAVVADYFPSEFAARANGALNLLHFGWAFVVQYGIGVVVGRWSPQDGHYPLAAYQVAFGLCLTLQVVALLWFAIPWLRTLVEHLRNSSARQSLADDNRTGFVAVPIEGAILNTREAMEW